MKGFNRLRDSRRRTELAVKSWQEANEALILAKLEQPKVQAGPAGAGSPAHKAGPPP